MYKELLIWPLLLEGQVVYPPDAREMVAKACDNFPVDPMIFNRMPDGKLVQGSYGTAEEGEGWGIPPQIFFGGGQGLIRITGLGLDGGDLLGREASTIATAVGTLLNTPYKFKVNTGQCTVKRSEPKVYWVRALMLSKQKNSMNAFKDKATGRFTLASVEPLIRRAVIGGVVSQARFLDEQCNEPALREQQIGTDDMLGLTVLGGEAAVIKAKKDAQVYALIVNNLVFSIDLELKGPWLAGVFRSRGFGLIRQRIVR